MSKHENTKVYFLRMSKKVQVVYEIKFNLITCLCWSLTDCSDGNEIQ